ncbi:MAG: BrnT family toxin [Acidithiobacillus ferrivorans]|uniref:BrnT family toxin n=1 Tax=Acidithiobacillus ferrivorans TaxID=160808 RepID=UPI0009F56E57|nr:BrnT family toxin [Acidithiobacillus sp. MC6.1]
MRYPESCGHIREVLIHGEPRYLVIGSINGKHWSAVVTYRGADIRLISARRSRTEEAALYES